MLGFMDRTEKVSVDPKDPGPTVKKPCNTSKSALNFFVFPFMVALLFTIKSYPWFDRKHDARSELMLHKYCCEHLRKTKSKKINRYTHTVESDSCING